MRKEELEFLKRDLEMMSMNQKLFYTDRIKERIENLFNYLQWAESFIEPYKAIEKEYKQQKKAIERYENALKKIRDLDYRHVIGDSYEGAESIADEALEGNTP